MKTIADIEYKVIRTISIKDSFMVNYLSNGIAEVVWSEKLDVIDINILKKLTQIMGTLNEGKKIPVYISTRSFMSLTKEANDYTATEASSKYTRANAVLVDELAKRLLFNFYMLFTKRHVPIKNFSTKDEAFEWLLNFKN